MTTNYYDKSLNRLEDWRGAVYGIDFEHESIELLIKPETAYPIIYFEEIETFQKVINIHKESDKDRWQFCPSKKCYDCHRDISDIKVDGRYVTGCPYCNYSFVE